MGNFWPSNCGNNNNSQVEQPKLFGKLPAPYLIKDIDPVLFIFTNNSVNEPRVTINSTYLPNDAVDLLLTNSCLDNCERFVVLTHGFRSSHASGWLGDMKNAIIQWDTKRTQTIAILGWGKGADLSMLKYGQAASNSIETGRWLGNFLAALRERCPKIEIYGIGHSLGAHLMGSAGRTSKSIDRITGLDPAGVGFQEDNIDKRLNSLDAQLVDVIHTDGQDVPYFGTLVPLGVVDFYPNYGWNQPTNDGQRSMKPDLDTDDKHHKIVRPSPYGGNISESHSRAVDYFIWSISNRHSFRTHLRLDGIPDVESAVHRVVTTGKDGTPNITLEMGYYCDRNIETQIQQQETNGQTCNIRPRSDVYTKYDQFAGCFYVHTNGHEPWC
ncbi:hypothetical protein RDWZM_002999 [Blomia tropicalis]|uniref:Lipase domain-containing protein n=1 Tax=Blomia tropicalis TaxID=40697 RepID=A0A9Q0RS37_BLOTA|nr:hypothetical protein BLOT_001000 [Blomia tropicalis]KAJ6224454.1 hypothetical protein RDWZM_002999 [Blomia tropicalis]